LGVCEALTPDREAGGSKRICKSWETGQPDSGVGDASLYLN